MHLQETFRNAFPCGSDSYSQVHLKVRESVLALLMVSSRSSQRLSPEIERSKARVAKSEPRALLIPFDNCDDSELESTFNWKDSQREQLIRQPVSRSAKKLFIENHIRAPCMKFGIA